MSPRPFSVIVAALTSAAMAITPFDAAFAWGNMSGGGYHAPAPGCNNGGGVVINKPMTFNKNINIYKPTTINNNVSVYKPVTINKDISIYKPVTINKNINIYKPVTINKDINITKNIDASKNITINKNININKSIVINKGGNGAVEASAFAAAMASASASASASSNVTVYGGGYYENVTVNNHGGDISGIRTSQVCRVQEANVVKAIHAVCISPDGNEFPASHMTGDTWLASSYEGEVMRCIPGAHLKVTIGDVVQSDQGMAGTYSGGKVLVCAENEALRHYKDGMLKCAVKVPVPDCTERTNLRRWGTGDMFFSYQTSVCVSGEQTSTRESRALDVTGMSLDGGVGEDGGY